MLSHRAHTPQRVWSATLFALTLSCSLALANAAPDSEQPALDTPEAPHPESSLNGSRKAEAPPSIDWDELLRQSNIAPISFPATAVTEAALDAKDYAWIKQRVLAPELAKLAGDPAESTLRPFFESLGDLSCKYERSALDAATLSRIKEQVKGTERRPGIDFLCGGLLQGAGDGDDELHAYDLVADSPAEAGLPSICRLYAAAKALAHWDHTHQGNREALEKRFFALFAANLDETPVDDEDLRHTVMVHLGGVIYDARRSREKQCLDLYRKSTLPDWARLSMIGQTEIQWAERLRGAGFFPASKKDRTESAAQVKNGREALAEAWKARPDMPYSSQNMLVSLARESRSSADNLRQWLDHALGAECDFELAFRNYFYGLRHATGSESTDLLAIGRACVETGRFDTALPTIFNLALCEAADDMENWRPFFTSPSIARAMLETRQKRLEKTAGGPYEKEQLLLLALESWLAGDDARAAQSVTRAATIAPTMALEYAVNFEALLLRIDPEIAIRDGALRGGPHGSEYKRAQEELARGQADAAIADFEKAAPDALPYAKALLNANLKLAKFAKRYAGGDWTPLPEGDRFCWSVLYGDWNWRPGVKRIRLTCRDPLGRTFFQGAMGADFELRGHMNASPPERKCGGVTLYCGSPPTGTGGNYSDAAAVQVFRSSDREVDVLYIPEEEVGNVKVKKTAKWSNNQPFLYHVQNGKVSFSLGENEIIHEQDLPPNRPTGAGAFGIGIVGYGEGAFAEVWGLEARKLPLAP